jgi:4'-phosphopantetheinyl transferase EntD
MLKTWLREDVELHLSPKFGSLQKEHRVGIRAALKQTLQNLGMEVGLERIEDLSEAPRLPEGSVSISHCRLLGGWAFSATSQRLGLDIEQIARVRPELALRMSNESEMEEAPHPAALWTAKEAAFKYLRGERQPLTAKEIRVTSWSLTAQGFYRFSAVYEGEIIPGVSWAQGDLVWASLC